MVYRSPGQGFTRFPIPENFLTLSSTRLLNKTRQVLPVRRRRKKKKMSNTKRLAVCVLLSGFAAAAAPPVMAESSPGVTVNNNSSQNLLIMFKQIEKNKVVKRGG